MKYLSVILSLALLKIVNFDIDQTVVTEENEWISIWNGETFNG